MPIESATPKSKRPVTEKGAHNKKARVVAEKEIKIYKCFDLIDTEGAIPILVDLNQLEQIFDDIDFRSFALFINHSLNRHSIPVFDHPGDSRSRFYNINYGFNNETYRGFAQRAVVDWYRDNVPGGSRMKLKDVVRLNCSPSSATWYYMTLTIEDELTGYEKTLQAMIMRLGCIHLQLGMLRDVAEDRVIGTICFKEAPTGATADIFAEKLNEDAKNKLM